MWHYVRKICRIDSYYLKNRSGRQQLDNLKSEKEYHQKFIEKFINEFCYTNERIVCSEFLKCVYDKYYYKLLAKSTILDSKSHH